MRDRAEDDESHLKRVARRPAPIKNADKANSGGNQKKKKQKKIGKLPSALAGSSRAIWAKRETDRHSFA